MRRLMVVPGATWSMMYSCALGSLARLAGTSPRRIPRPVFDVAPLAPKTPMAGASAPAISRLICKVRRTPPFVSGHRVGDGSFVGAGDLTVQEERQGRAPSGGVGADRHHRTDRGGSSGE